MWKPKLQVLGSQKFWHRPNIHIGMHASCERRLQQERRREVQLVSSLDNAIRKKEKRKKKKEKRKKKKEKRKKKI
jgi:hypothetical protein